jgi:hypothetical protein
MNAPRLPRTRAPARRAQQGASLLDCARGESARRGLWGGRLELPLAGCRGRVHHSEPTGRAYMFVVEGMPGHLPGPRAKPSSVEVPPFGSVRYRIPQDGCAHCAKEYGCLGEENAPPGEGIQNALSTQHRRARSRRHAGLQPCAGAEPDDGDSQKGSLQGSGKGAVGAHK